MARRSFFCVLPMKPASLPHLLISASAGSGKTWQLVRRHLHLLALGEMPEQIAAMTFTRKAAGEFFNRILRQLALLSAKHESAEAYFQGCVPAVPAEADFLPVLRQVTRRMHRLRLGTLDSFFASVATCFPLELGLGSQARVMDETETAQASRVVLDALLEKLHREENARALSQLMEAHKLATFGVEEKSVDDSLRQLTADWLALWDDSDATLPLRGWGDLGFLGLPEAAGEMRPLSELITAVRTHFIPHAKGIALLEETLTQAQETAPGHGLPKRVKELLEKLEPLWDALTSGHAEMMWQRVKTVLTPQAGAAFKALVEGLLVRELRTRAARTRGLAEILALHAAEHEALVRQRGRLSFADVQRLLARAAEEKTPWLGAGEDLWFRLDSRHAHWMLDEFQDTSQRQWQVISCLVDEVMQDSGGRRSFFAVGDPKQSIYLWREAEPGLFDHILSTWPARADGGGLRQMPLSVSYRSAQPVLDMVNAAFGNAEALATLLPRGSMEGFRFQEHRAHKTALSGHAALLSPLPEREENEEEIGGTTGVIAQVLEHIQPLARGLTCAVLVRTNDEAARISEVLRHRTGMAVVCEADLHPCTDNALTLALLSLLSLTAHPGDAKARNHLRMSPLWPLVETETEGTCGEARQHWRRTVQECQKTVHEHGIAGFMEVWAPRIRAHVPELDAFHQRRLAQMADIAAEYDASGSRCVDGFLRFAREYPLRLRGPARSIQVMTLHASKGLEFDLVLQVAHEGRAMNQVREGRLLAGRQERGGIAWVLEPPPRACMRLTPALKAQLAEAERRAAFESLCRLYVGMTRAIRGLYVIAKPPPKDGKSLTEAKLLRSVLPADAPEPSVGFGCIEWQTGDPQWFHSAALQPETSQEAPAPAPVGAPEPLGNLLRAHQPLTRRRTPSGEETFQVKGSVLFSAGRGPGRELGTLVHELLAHVTWQPHLPSLENQWRRLGIIPKEEGSGTSATLAEALRQVKAVLSAPSCAAVFTAPDAQAKLWRERSFDLMLDGGWVTGTFDRVLIEQDKEGRATAAWIVDFKTDDAPDEAALEEKCQGYAPQLALYRRAVARLCALPESEVRTSLLFTRQSRLMHISAC